MVVLDTTIANVSVPHIAGALAVSPAQGTWVITSYSVAEAITVPLTGWLAQRFGAVRVFAFGMAGFGLFSLLCGLAPSFALLVAFRVAQGLCGGPIMPMSQTLMLHIFPRERAGAAMGLWGMTTVVAPIVGPILGGQISDNLHWSWIFLINIPVAAFVGILAYRMLIDHDTATRKVPVDYVGLGLLVTWVGAMQIMLDKGKELDWFHSPEVLTLAIVSAVGFAFLVAWELTDDHPVVDLRMLKVRNFWTGTLCMTVAYSLFMGNLVLLPLWLQQFMGYTSTQAGELMAPVGLFAIILSPLVGKNIQKFDPRALTTFAFLVFALVLFMRSHFNTQADFGTLMLPTIIQGVAVAFFFIPLTTITLNGIAPDKIAGASGLSSFARIVGGSFGTSIAITVWQDRAALHHAQLAELINRGSVASNAALSNFAAAGMSTEQALSQINRLIDQQAFVLAANDVFYASSIIFILLIPMVWLARPIRVAAHATSASADAAAGAH
ncbi:MAG: MFS transporter [Phenylobacterium zucineum]|nr:MAG: MFS transporter [Phenylobacterium zucineum]